jgi:hypothetical protein
VLVSQFNYFGVLAFKQMDRSPFRHRQGFPGQEGKAKLVEMPDLKGHKALTDFLTVSNGNSKDYDHFDAVYTQRRKQQRSFQAVKEIYSRWSVRRTGLFFGRAGRPEW